MRALPLALAFATTPLAALPISAQDNDFRPRTNFHVGASFVVAKPVGEFNDFIDSGYGLTLEAGYQPPSSILGVALSGGFVIYGSETKQVCFSQTVGCRVLLDLKTNNAIVFLGLEPRLMLPAGPIRPFLDTSIGLSYFATTSSVEGTQSDEDFASTTNLDDLVFAWTGGGGVLVPLGRGDVSLELAARYHGNGDATYLREGDIIDNPDGSITLQPNRSETNMLTFRLGVRVALRKGD